MKYEYISNLSEEKLVKLYPKIKLEDIEFSGTKALIIDYGRYAYELNELFDKVKVSKVSDIFIKISLQNNSTSKERMKEILREIYDQSFQLKKKHPLLRLHMLEGEKFYWLTNALPTHLTIEPTNMCHLNCVGCPKFPDNQGMMKFEDFKNILLQFKKINRLELYHRGEPLLHPDIIKFIKFAKDVGSERVEISTNFNIKNDKLIKDLAKSKLDRLLIGLEGATKETYQAFRRGGDFGLVISNIRKIKEWNPNCKIIIQFMPHKFNEHELHKTEILAKKLGADYFKIKIFETLDREFLPTIHRFRWEKIYASQTTMDFSTVTTKKFICKEVMDSLLIQWDGLVYPCCGFQGTYDLAPDFMRKIIPKNFPYNIFNTRPAEIWMDEKYFQLRASFLKDSPIDICKLCNNEELIKPHAGEKKII